MLLRGGADDGERTEGAFADFVVVAIHQGDQPGDDFGTRRLDAAEALDRLEPELLSLVFHGDQQRGHTDGAEARQHAAGGQSRAEPGCLVLD